MLLKETVRLLLIPVFFTFAGMLPSAVANELQTLVGAELIDDPANDGDSFLVRHDDEEFRIRLYFVDCPETYAGTDSDARRLREQTRYWGLNDEKQTLEFGQEAKAFVEQILAQGFTIHTAFANAMGRSASGRIYAFVTVGDGCDLAELLVKNGMARPVGMGRKTPSGKSRDETFDRLRDIEISAMLKRIGIWSKSDPDRITELRAEQRSENYELEELKRRIDVDRRASAPINLNTASREELQSLKGIGPVLADRIINKRPFKTVDELLKVEGIGSKTLEKIAGQLTVDK